MLAMTAKHDIQQLEDVETLVHRFYETVQEDVLLGPIFNERLDGKWDEHLAKMVRFWQTILLHEHTYNGAPFPPHATMPIGESHFDRWKSLFVKTVDTYFEGANAEEAKNRAQLMAHIFQTKIDYLQKNNLAETYVNPGN